MNTSKTALALIAVTVIIAGCSDTGTNDSATTAGLTINNFSAVPSTTFAGQSAQVLLNVRNDGGIDARNTVARLYQAPIGTGSGSWSIQGDEGQSAYIGRIRAADPQNEIPAQERRQTWSLTAPSLEAQSIDYNFQTRVYYDYSTQATTEIQLVQEEEFLQGDYTPSRPSTDNTNAPIQLEVSTRSPVRYFEGDSEPSSDLCVTVRNQGQGTPFDPSVFDDVGPDNPNIDLSSSQRDEVTVTVSDSAGVDFGGDSEETSTTVSLTGSRGNHCFDMTLPSSSSFSITQTVPLTITSDYGYYTDDSTVVTVQPTR